MGTNFLFSWREAIISTHGPGAITRHVLLTLSLHMDGNGDSCFPSVRTLAAETALSRRTICTHLKKAEKNGWIKKMIQGLSGKGWKRHGYLPEIPGKVGNEVHHVNQKGGERGSPRLTEGGEPDDIKVGNEVPTSTSSSTSYLLSELLFSLIQKNNPKARRELRKEEKKVNLKERQTGMTLLRKCPILS